MPLPRAICCLSIINIHGARRTGHRRHKACRHGLEVSCSVRTAGGVGAYCLHVHSLLEMLLQYCLLTVCVAGFAKCLYVCGSLLYSKKWENVLKCHQFWMDCVDGHLRTSWSFVRLWYLWSRLASSLTWCLQKFSLTVMAAAAAILASLTLMPCPSRLHEKCMNS